MVDSSNKNSLFKSTIVVAGLTSVSRVIGLIRDVLISNVLGVSYITDIFIVALRIPNIFRRITAEGAFSSAFIPMFSKKLTLSKISAIKFSEDILFVSLIVMTLITSLFQILSRIVIKVLFIQHLIFMLLRMQGDSLRGGLLPGWFISNF